MTEQDGVKYPKTIKWFHFSSFIYKILYKNWNSIWNSVWNYHWLWFCFLYIFLLCLHHLIISFLFPCILSCPLNVAACRSMYSFTLGVCDFKWGNLTCICSASRLQYILDLQSSTFVLSFYASRRFILCLMSFGLFFIYFVFSMNLLNKHELPPGWQAFCQDLGIK